MEHSEDDEEETFDLEQLLQDDEKIPDKDEDDYDDEVEINIQVIILVVLVYLTHFRSMSRI